MNMSFTLEELMSGVSVQEILCGPIPTYRRQHCRASSLGISSDIREAYATYLQSEPGIITVGTVQISAAPQAVAALKAVLVSGISRIEERSKACRQVFERACMALDPATTFQVDTLLSTFDDGSNDPFVIRIQEVLKEVLSDASQHT